MKSFSTNHLSLLVVPFLIVGMWGCGEQPQDPPNLQISESGLSENESHTADLNQDIEQFCGACHPPPKAEYFARDSWYEEVQRGFDFHLRSKRTDLTPPPKGEVVAYYRERAPEALLIPTRPETDDGGLKFRQELIPSPEDLGTKLAAISYITWVNSPPESSRLLLSDMKGGGVYQLDFSSQPRHRSLRSLAELDHPAHIEICDLNRDGISDLLVADLGSFLPEDHQKGRVVWLHQGESGAWNSSVLLAGLGRVADVRVGDLNADEWDDILVGEFGWIETGAIRKMIRVDVDSSQDTTPLFKETIVDDRHGVIHLPLIDWNADGHSDFVALLSQEHETIELFLNDGSGEFANQTISPSEDPAFGSSGIQLVDLDLDGDQDVLYTNGDTFDSFDVKFYHSIQWIENLGDQQFKTHHLTAMPGVHRALTGDVDGDGDLDIIAVALLPEKSIRKANRQPGDFDSVIWLEQIKAGKFERHSLEVGKCYHATFEIGDFDGDGDLDFATGNFLGNTSQFASLLTIWWNETMPNE